MPRRIRAMLYGDQAIEATEVDLLHTPALQRLYDLHQLGLTDRVSSMPHTRGSIMSLEYSSKLTTSLGPWLPTSNVSRLAEL